MVVVTVGVRLPYLRRTAHGVVPFICTGSTVQYGHPTRDDRQRPTTYVDQRDLLVSGLNSSMSSLSDVRLSPEYLEPVPIRVFLVRRIGLPPSLTHFSNTRSRLDSRLDLSCRFYGPSGGLRTQQPQRGLRPGRGQGGGEGRGFEPTRGVLSSHVEGTGTDFCPSSKAPVTGSSYGRVWGRGDYKVATTGCPRSLWVPPPPSRTSPETPSSVTLPSRILP